MFKALVSSISKNQSLKRAYLSVPVLLALDDYNLRRFAM